MSVAADRIKTLAKLSVASGVGYLLLRKLLSTSKVDYKEKGPIRINKETIKVGVDKRFLKQFKYIIRICVPKWKSPIVGIVALHTVFLVLRTYLTVIIARIDGKIVKDMVAGQGKSFMRTLGIFMMMALPATFTNAMIKHLQSILGTSLRKRLTDYVHKLYMSNNVYYKAINLDNRIDGADQLITTDINKFCTALASLYSNLGKPVLDIIIFNYQLSKTIGVKGMWGMLANYVVTATILRAATPQFGKMAAQEAKLEGDFRSAHSRLITNAEEIGFYNGEELEKNLLDRTYGRLIKHINSIYKIRIGYNMFEDFVVKYSWSAFGLLMAAVPVFYPESAGSYTKSKSRILTDDYEETPEEMIVGNRTQGFITNKRLMVSLADAGGRIMYSYKELSQLAGYTYRVYNMLRVLDDLSNNMFLPQDNVTNPPYTIEHTDGIYSINSNVISFKETDIVTPMGDSILVKNLSVKINSGEHLMITGPNGSGKTSIMRVLAGIWPHFKGEITKPKPEEIFYIPQRPYLAVGTLREQVIYPHSEKQMRQAGRTDEELAAILKIVYLDYIPNREGGWDSIKEWKDVFSGGFTYLLGEKQRMQLARVFYHKPKFVCLDESTSAVSSDVEALLYNTAKDQGITLITISHRPTLLKYHPYLLKLVDGKKWEFSQIGSFESLSNTVECEVKLLQKELAQLGTLRKRLNEINNELGLHIKKSGDKDLSNAKRTLV